MAEKMAIYYDTFANEYCLPSKRDLGVAPPERYLRTLSNPAGYYVEHWEVGDSPNGNLLDIAYRDPDHANLIRNEMAHRNNCKLLYIRWWEIPSDKFNKYVKRFCL